MLRHQDHAIVCHTFIAMVEPSNFALGLHRTATEDDLMLTEWGYSPQTSYGIEHDVQFPLSTVFFHFGGDGE